MIKTETRLGRTHIIATDGELIHTATSRRCSHRTYLLNGESVADFHEEPATEAAEAARQAEQAAAYKARVTELIRERYDSDDETALLRQRDTKPEEFAAYNAYVERCKTIAREAVTANPAEDGDAAAD